MMGLLRHSAALGFVPPDVPVSLGEGDTPLLPSLALGPRWGVPGLHFKCDHVNPTGSYKDRFALFLINAMLRDGQTACLATSSGNTGSALAAYAARAGVRLTLAINQVTPAGKLAQMAAHGARLLRIEGFGEDAVRSRAIWDGLQRLAEDAGLPFVVSAFAYCPEAMRGVSTIAYELLDQLGGPPDAVYVPVGGGGMYSAICLGFADHGVRVRVEPVQPATNDTIITPWHTRLARAVAVEDGVPCRISGLSVPIDIDGTRAMGHARAVGAYGEVVDEDTIRDVQAELYREEGLSVEPAGAVSVAGVRAAALAGRLEAAQTVVAVLTGHGFKDPARQQIIADELPVEDVTLDTLELGDSR